MDRLSAFHVSAPCLFKNFERDLAFLGNISDNLLWRHNTFACRGDDSEIRCGQSLLQVANLNVSGTLKNKNDVGFFGNAPSFSDVLAQ